MIEKAAHRLTIFRGDKPLKVYQVALGSSLAPKRRKRDGRTPEGLYRIDSHNRNSSFHRALHISYPSAQDKARAAALGVDPGGDIMIHGIHNGLGWLGLFHRTVDWTKGCIAVNDNEN